MAAEQLQAAEGTHRLSPPSVPAPPAAPGLPAPQAAPGLPAPQAAPGLPAPQAAPANAVPATPADAEPPAPADPEPPAGAAHRLAPALRAAGTIVLAAAPFLFILGLKPFAYGIWFQAEPVTVGLLSLGAAAALCLAGLDATGHAAWSVFRQPPLLCLLGLAGWSALISPLLDFPARSWFGAPETGEGIFAFLSLAMLIGLGWTLWPYRRSRLAMAGAAVAGALVIGGLNASLPAGSPWRPQLLGAYAGLVGPAAALVLLGMVRRPTARSAVAAFLVGLPAVLFSQSKVALLLDGVLAPLACWLLFRFQPRWRPAVRRRAFTAGPLLAVGVFALIVAIGMVAPPINVYEFVPHRLADGVLHFVSAGPTGIDVFYSVRSRGLLALTGFAGLLEHPLAWLGGFGWGSFADLMYRHTFIDGVKGFQRGTWAPSWEGVGAGAFHSHSDPLEALFAAGLPGAACYLLFLCTIVWRSRRGMLVFAAVGWFVIAGLLSEWYPDLLVYPFLALAVVACCAPHRPPPHQPPPHRAPPLRPARAALAARGLCLALAAVLAFGAQATATDAINGGRLLAALNKQQPAEVRAVGALPGDYGRGGVHLWWAALNYVYFIDTQLAQGHAPTPAQAAIYARLLEEVDTWTAQGRAGVRLAALTVAIRNDLAANQANTALAWLRQSELAHWDAAVLDLIRRAPDRTDVAVPDLAWLMAGHHYVAVLALCDRIFRIHPGDRVCLWYSGAAMVTDPLTQETAFKNLREALALGVGAVVPVTPAARQAVEAHFAPAGK